MTWGQVGPVAEIAQARTAGTDELRPGNAGWGENGTVRFEVAARKQDDGKSGSSPDAR